MMEWLNMDGDGIYVWPCYILTLIVMVANVWIARSNHASLIKRATARSRVSNQTTSEAHSS